MVAYIQQLLKEIRNRIWCDVIKERGSLIEVLTEELNRLDPRDFPIDQQYDFVELRRQTRRINNLYQIDESHWELQQGVIASASEKQNQLRAKLSNKSDPAISITEEETKAWTSEIERLKSILNNHQEGFLELLGLCDKLIIILGTYGGQGSSLNTKQFPFITDTELKSIVERDYRSLIIELIPSGAWKSAVIMAGSVLEAILYDQLTKDPGQVARAMASPKAPKKKGGAVKDITSDDREDEWTLSNFIEVSVDLGILPQARADAIDQVLRDYRNFVHPRKELRAGHPCTEAEADLAKGALGAVINHLTP
ncbi:MAG TPA: hypothetical protein VG122_02435 [Gemmata sp.]|jgi:hypothetical protein|nr:hypothetical protein [Gemmata sp.]